MFQDSRRELALLLHDHEFSCRLYLNLLLGGLEQKEMRERDGGSGEAAARTA